MKRALRRIQVLFFCANYTSALIDTQWSNELDFFSESEAETANNSKRDVLYPVQLNSEKQKRRPLRQTSTQLVPSLCGVCLQ